MEHNLLPGLSPVKYTAFQLQRLIPCIEEISKLYFAVHFNQKSLEINHIAIKKVYEIVSSLVDIFQNHDGYDVTMISFGELSNRLEIVKIIALFLAICAVDSSGNSQSPVETAELMIKTDSILPFLLPLHGSNEFNNGLIGDKDVFGSLHILQWLFKVSSDFIRSISDIGTANQNANFPNLIKFLEFLDMFAEFCEMSLRKYAQRKKLVQHICGVTQYFDNLLSFIQVVSCCKGEFDASLISGSLAAEGSISGVHCLSLSCGKLLNRLQTHIECIVFDEKHIEDFSTLCLATKVARRTKKEGASVKASYHEEILQSMGTFLIDSDAKKGSVHDRCYAVCAVLKVYSAVSYRLLSSSYSSTKTGLYSGTTDPYMMDAIHQRKHVLRSFHMTILILQHVSNKFGCEELLMKPNGNDREINKSVKKTKLENDPLQSTLNDKSLAKVISSFQTKAYESFCTIRNQLLYTLCCVLQSVTIPTHDSVQKYLDILQSYGTHSLLNIRNLHTRLRTQHTDKQEEGIGTIMEITNSEFDCLRIISMIDYHSLFKTEFASEILLLLMEEPHVSPSSLGHEYQSQLLDYCTKHKIFTEIDLRPLSVMTGKRVLQKGDLTIESCLIQSQMLNEFIISSSHMEKVLLQTYHSKTLLLFLLLSLHHQLRTFDKFIAVVSQFGRSKENGSSFHHNLSVFEHIISSDFIQNALEIIVRNVPLGQFNSMWSAIATNVMALSPPESSKSSQFEASLSKKRKTNEIIACYCDDTENTVTNMLSISVLVKHLCRGHLSLNANKSSISFTNKPPADVTIGGGNAQLGYDLHSCILLILHQFTVSLRHSISLSDKDIVTDTLLDSISNIIMFSTLIFHSRSAVLKLTQPIDHFVESASHHSIDSLLSTTLHDLLFQLVKEGGTTGKFICNRSIILNCILRLLRYQLNFPSDMSQQTEDLFINAIQIIPMNAVRVSKNNDSNDIYLDVLIALLKHFDIWWIHIESHLIVTRQMIPEVTLLNLFSEYVRLNLTISLQNNEFTSEKFALITLYLQSASLRDSRAMNIIMSKAVAQIALDLIDKLSQELILSPIMERLYELIFSCRIRIQNHFARKIYSVLQLLLKKLSAESEIDKQNILTKEIENATLIIIRYLLDKKDIATASEDQSPFQTIERCQILSLFAQLIATSDQNVIGQLIGHSNEILQTFLSVSQTMKANNYLKLICILLDSIVHHLLKESRLIDQTVEEKDQNSKLAEIFFNSFLSIISRKSPLDDAQGQAELKCLSVAMMCILNRIQSEISITLSIEMQKETTNFLNSLVEVLCLKAENHLQVCKSYTLSSDVTLGLLSQSFQGVMSLWKEPKEMQAEDWLFRHSQKANLDRLQSLLLISYELFSTKATEDTCQTIGWIQLFNGTVSNLLRSSGIFQIGFDEENASSRSFSVDARRMIPLMISLRNAIELHFNSQKLNLHSSEEKNLNVQIALCSRPLITILTSCFLSMDRNITNCNLIEIFQLMSTHSLPSKDFQYQLIKIRMHSEILLYFARNGFRYQRIVEKETMIAFMDYMATSHTSAVADFIATLSSQDSSEMLAVCNHLELVSKSLSTATTSSQNKNNVKMDNSFKYIRWIEPLLSICGLLSVKIPSMYSRADRFSEGNLNLDLSLTFTNYLLGYLRSITAVSSAFSSFNTNIGNVIHLLTTCAFGVLSLENVVLASQEEDKEEEAEAGKHNESNTDRTDAKHKIGQCYRLVSQILMDLSQSKDVTKHMHLIASVFVHQLSQLNISKAFQDNVYPGIFSMFEKCSTKQKNQIFNLLDAQAKAFMNELHSEFMRNFKFIGK